MNESKKELGSLHCLYFIYYSFSTNTDDDFNPSQVRKIINYLNEWTKDSKSSEAIISETMDWIKETNPSKNEGLNIMFSMVDYLMKENTFSFIQKELLLLHIRDIARADGTFSEEEKKYHDLLAHHLGLPLRVSSCSTKEIEDSAEEVKRTKIGFRINRS